VHGYSFCSNHPFRLERIKAEDILALNIPSDEQEPLTSIEDPDLNWNEVDGQWILLDNVTKIRTAVRKYLCDAWSTYCIIHNLIPAH
jgi:hypothetical protein